MTTIYKEVAATTLKKEFVSCTCDWCGKSLPEEDDTGYGTYSMREFTFTSGYCYPDDVGGEGWCIEDLCDGCVERLRMSLLQMGIRLAKISF